MNVEDDKREDKIENKMKKNLINCLNIKKKLK